LVTTGAAYAQSGNSINCSTQDVDRPITVLFTNGTRRVALQNISDFWFDTSPARERFE